MSSTRKWNLRLHQSVIWLLTFLLTFSSGITFISPVTVSAEEGDEDTVVYVSNGGDDSNNGSEGSPYATIGTAFSKVADKGTVVLLNDITLTSTQLLNTEKEVTIKSKDGEKHSIIRDENFKGLMIHIESKANVTFKNLMIDGNNVEVRGSDITEVVNRHELRPIAIFTNGASSKLTLDNTNIINHKPNVARVLFTYNSATLEITNDTKFQQNKLVGNFGGAPPAILDAGNGGRIEFKDGEISDNTVTEDSNGVMVGIGYQGVPTFHMTGGKITNNHLHGVATDTGNIAVFMRGQTNNSRYEFGGTAYVYDNTNAAGNQRNVFLANTNWENAYLSLVSELTEGAKIGVYANRMPDSLSEGKVLVARTLQGTAGNPEPIYGTEYYTPTVDDAAFFESDKASSAEIQFENNQIILAPTAPKLDNVWLNQTTVEGKEITLTFNGGVKFDNELQGLTVKVGNDTVPPEKITIDSHDPSKLIVTLPDKPTENIELTYTKTSGNLKGIESNKDVENFDFTYEFSFVTALVITEPGDDSATVTESKPQLSGTTKAGSTVTVVVKDEDGNVVEDAGGSATGNGNWTFAPGVDLASGHYTFEVTATALTDDGRTISVTKTKEIIVHVPSLSAAPGGVGGATLWLNPGAGINVSNGDKVSEWQDQSGQDNHATQTDGSLQPTYSNNPQTNVNFNPMLNFDGSNYLDLDNVNKLPTGKAPRSIVAVAATNTLSGNHYILSWGNASPNQMMGMLQLGTAGSLTGFTNEFTSDQEFWQQNVPNELFGTYDGTVGALYSRMFEIGKENRSWETGNNGAKVGALVNGNERWEGTIGDVIVFDKVLDETDRQKLSSYLSIKYGYTLDGVDYLSSNRAIVWEADATYSNNIAGIACDDNGSLLQKQSNSTNAGAQVIINVGELATTNLANTGNLDDGQYLIWGDNGKDLTFTKQIGTTNKNHADRIWKVQNTNAVGEVSVAIPKSVLPANASLFVGGSDTDFSGATEYALTETIFESITYLTTKVTLANGQFFTFAAPAPVPQSATLEQTVAEGNKMTLTFDQEVALTIPESVGFMISVGDDSIDLTGATFAVDPSDAKKLVITLPAGTDVTGKEVKVSYSGSGNLKGTNDVPINQFTMDAEDSFAVALKINEPSGDPAQVTKPMPEIKGIAEVGSTVDVAIKDSSIRR